MNKKLSWDQLKNIENIYGRYACVRSLLDHIGIMNGELAEAKKTEEKAVGDLGRVGLELAALKRQQPEPVEVPKTVAEAFDRVITTWEKKFSEEKIAGFLLNPDGFITGNEDAKTLRQYASVEPFKYMQAIANGYAVEQTTEDRIEAKLTAALEESGIECPIPVTHFAHQLARAVREVLAEEAN
ncbi:hypothetical protein EV294_101342 [Paenibacillus sp. BK033]|uniref:hypothetical protein n=1 Tax=Paenibacillus sp. BK033 TaxID=2512133 RepID=UPI0010519533|nr:hypothetical protein [Paenibacillus sp. BK033]TCN00892.1 hypothetical protein EV294_101342 [Paenibacillus sp. BK033]